MKQKTSTSVIALCIIAIFSGSNCFGQDWNKMDSKTVKKMVDTTLMRALEVTIMAGEKGEVHTHPAHFFYALTDCKLAVHYSDGKVEKFDMPAGASGFSNPERPHWTENVGDKPAKFLLVELKEHPYKAMPAKK